MMYPMFTLYKVDNNRVEINAEELYKMAVVLKNINRNKSIEFVRADHFFSYYNEYNGLPFNLNMLASTKVTASGGSTGFQKPSAPENVMDGSNRTMWVSSKPGTGYLQFDFNEYYSINRYVIRHAETAGMSGEYNTRSWIMEVSADGDRWENVDTYISNSSAVTDIDISPVTARYAKIKITDPGDENIIRIVGVEIYGGKL